ncbi:MAG: ComEC/Rec2 family competence protein [Candidatus Gracilibacteria bacterium]|nr:ComEC/Rec2 family competence protein [Candidatus Gracilibacteria bacterium]
MLFISLGAFYGFIITNNNFTKIQNNTNFLEKYYLRTSKYDLEIINLYKKDDFYNSYVAKINKIDELNIDKNIYGIVNVASNINLNKGELLALNGQILKIDNVDNSFDYKTYLLVKNIYFKLYLYNYKVVGDKNTFLTKLDLFRNKLIKIINNIYPNEESILLSGILIGARENIPKELSNDFNNSGTTHIIAVSGFNITILIIFLGFLFKFIPIFIRTILIFSFLVIFCFFVGLEASVIRAGIMGIIGYSITSLGRKSSSITTVLITCFFMLLYNPLYINYDLSFQLSFLAVLGILFTKNFFDKIFYFFPETLAIKESFSITMSAMIFTLPITIFNFGQFVLLTPISNILVSWNISFIMLFGFLSILGYYIYPFLGIIIGFFSYIFLKFDLSVIHYFGKLHNFIIKTDFGEYSLYFEIIYFIILGYLIFILNNKKK